MPVEHPLLNATGDTCTCSAVQVCITGQACCDENRLQGKASLLSRCLMDLFSMTKHPSV